MCKNFCDAKCGFKDTWFYSTLHVYMRDVSLTDNAHTPDRSAAAHVVHACLRCDASTKQHRHGRRMAEAHLLSCDWLPLFLPRSALPSLATVRESKGTSIATDASRQLLSCCVLTRRLCCAFFCAAQAAAPSAAAPALPRSSPAPPRRCPSSLVCTAAWAATKHRAESSQIAAARALQVALLLLLLRPTLRSPRTSQPSSPSSLSC